MQLKQQDPETGGAVENMCKALLATRGVLIAYECENILRYVNQQIKPWVRMTAPMLQDERNLRVIVKKGNKRD